MGEFFHGRQCNVASTSPSSREHCGRLQMPLLGIERPNVLHALQQRLPNIFNGPDSPKIAPCREKISTPYLMHGSSWTHVS